MNQHSEQFEESFANHASLPSRDLEFLLGMQEIVRVVEESGVDWFVIGSVALQSHFERPHRIPNDIDVVLGDGNFERLFELCLNRGWKVVKSVGRIRVWCQSIPVHFLPSGLSLVDKRQNRVAARVEIHRRLTRVSRQFCLLCSPVRVDISTLPVEEIFCLSMAKPLNTNSILDAKRALTEINLEIDGIASFCNDYPPIGRLVVKRFEELERFVDDDERLMRAIREIRLAI